jgi:transposase-like protein
VPRPGYPLTILEFQKRFATEEDCRDYLFESRWPDGFVCPACAAPEVGAETRRHLWICTGCGRQTSITAGTVMHKTRMPLRTWFWAAYLVSTFHPGISAKQLQRQLGIGSHETAWAMLHKLRAAMVAPERTALEGEVEIDEFFLGGYEEGLKGGRQRGKKVLCGVAIEVRGRGSGRLRLAVLPNATGPSLLAFTRATTAAGAVVHTDGLQSYRALAKHGYDHRRLTQTDVAPGGQLLPRAHRAISNLKAWMHGTHRGVSPEHLPAYLDEFVFRHNRRGTPMAGFQTLLGLGLARDPITYDQIINRAA